MSVGWDEGVIGMQIGEVARLRVMLATPFSYMFPLEKSHSFLNLLRGSHSQFLEYPSSLFSPLHIYAALLSLFF